MSPSETLHKPREERRGLLVVTGAGRGIGAAVAAIGAQQGYGILVNCLRDVEAAQGVRNRIRAMGGRAEMVQANIGTEDGVMSLFRAADSMELPLTGLVNNAGMTGGLSRLENLEAAVLRSVLAVNIEGPLLCAREAVRRMSKKRGGQGGSIVNVSSMAAKLGGGGEWIHYAASKGAIETFTTGLAREVAAEGIRVNAVAPGLIDTELHAAAGAPNRVRELAPSIPMGRSGSSSEVAETVLWLISAAASYVTGAIVPVAGGR